MCALQAGDRLRVYSTRNERLQAEMASDEAENPAPEDPTPAHLQPAQACRAKWAVCLAVEEASSALDLDPQCAAALVCRARCFAELGDHAESVLDLERALAALSAHGGGTAAAAGEVNASLVQLELRDAQRRLAANPMDHYRVLGLAPGASADEVKKAFRRLAIKCHPDKQAGLGREARERMERRFKEITEANSVLSDSVGPPGPSPARAPALQYRCAARVLSSSRCSSTHLSFLAAALLLSRAQGWLMACAGSRAGSVGLW